MCSENNIKKTDAKVQLVLFEDELKHLLTKQFLKKKKSYKIHWIRSIYYFITFLSCFYYYLKAKLNFEVHVQLAAQIIIAFCFNDHYPYIMFPQGSFKIFNRKF